MVAAGCFAPSCTVTTSLTTAVMTTLSTTVFTIGLATMLVANRRGVSVEDRIFVSKNAFGKDGIGDHRSPEKYVGVNDEG